MVLRNAKEYRCLPRREPLNNKKINMASSRDAPAGTIHARASGSSVPPVAGNKWCADEKLRMNGLLT